MLLSSTLGECSNEVFEAVFGSPMSDDTSSSDLNTLPEREIRPARAIEVNHEDGPSFDITVPQELNCNEKENADDNQITCM